MRIWNLKFVRKLISERSFYQNNLSELEKPLTEYTKQLINRLEKEATDKDVYIANSAEPPEILKRIAEKLGYEYVKAKCSVCGREVYVLNVKTKAKIVCIECAHLAERKPFGG